VTILVGQLFFDPSQISYISKLEAHETTNLCNAAVPAVLTTTPTHPAVWNSVKNPRSGSRSPNRTVRC